MGSLSFPLLILIISFKLLLLSIKIEADQAVKSARLLDLYIRDYTFKSFDNTMKTGKIHSVHLPANFTTIKVETARFRCGSLNRYGARLSQLQLGIGVNVQPCVDRLMMVAQNLGSNWSSIYYSNYDLSGYELVSPVLGLLAYNVDVIDANSRNPFELGIQAAITLDFRNASRDHAPNSTSKAQDTELVRRGILTGIENITTNTWCASFENNGQVKFKRPISPFFCAANKNGHYALVIQFTPSSAPPPTAAVVVGKKKISTWKVAVGTSIGSALGAFLLGLLLVAMFVRVKKKAKMEEIERRGYEEEALQVTMVGHVKAPLATGSRTVPTTIEHEYTYYHP